MDGRPAGGAAGGMKDMGLYDSTYSKDIANVVRQDNCLFNYFLHAI